MLQQKSTVNLTKKKIRKHALIVRSQRQYIVHITYIFPFPTIRNFLMRSSDLTLTPRLKLQQQLNQIKNLVYTHFPVNFNNNN